MSQILVLIHNLLLYVLSILNLEPLRSLEINSDLILKLYNQKMAQWDFKNDYRMVNHKLLNWIFLLKFMFFGYIFLNN